MTTIKQALLDEIPFPVSEGLVEIKATRRGLDIEEDITPDMLSSKEYLGALADCLYSLIETPNFNEADKSVSVSDRNLIIKKVNALYNAIGEETAIMVDKPMVYFGG